MQMRLCASLGLLCLVPLTLPAQQLRLSGSVRSGQPYTHSLGQGLSLVLTASSIAVQGADGENYAQCATGPGHGPSEIDLEAWHFKPTKDQDFPDPRHRKFEFAVSAADNNRVCDELEAELYGKPVTGKDSTAVLGDPNYRSPTLGKGEISLSDVVITGRGQDADIESYRFAADITMPPAEKK
jgi:hypothetical protein